MFVTSNAKHVIVPWQENLARVVPHARTLVHEGARMLVLPNRQDEIRVARNLGLAIPSPVLTSYDWLGKKPWDIQRTTTALLAESPRAYVLNEFGTGKTRSVIWAADYLKRTDNIGPVLVTAPLSTLTPVWEAELFRLIPAARVQLIHGTKARRIERLKEDADWYIINHHGLDLMLDELIARKFQIFVIDELAVLRNRRTLWWKAANVLMNNQATSVKYVWGLTGSPTPKAPTDAWAQIKLMTPGQTTRTFTRFRDLTMRQVSPFRWVKRNTARQLIHDQMQPAVRFALDDVTELPAITYRSQKVPLEPEAAQAYQLMMNKLRVITKNGETITAVNEAVLQSKLLQVSCGFIYTDKKGIYRLPVNSRLQALLDIVESTDRKFLVFVPFLHALDGVATFLQKAGEDIAVVHGQTPVGFRNKVFRSFQESLDEVRGIVAHPACMSHGLTLTAANTVIWYSPVNNYETYEQANARVYRPGQTSKTLIAHLIGTPVEQATYRRLQERGNFQGMLLELFHRQEQDL
jgi:SNF2 family DNA or RNA helicase